MCDPVPPCILKYCDNRNLIQSYGNIGYCIEALRHRCMDTAVYRNRAFEGHEKIFDLLAVRNVSKACDVLSDHISRTKQFYAKVNGSSGRSRRKDYKFRDYSKAFKG
jgi:DNA-binding GntR family transcriptional regulator